MKKQVGRPKVSLAKKKSSKVFINLTEEQKGKLEKLAEREELSLSYTATKKSDKNFKRLSS